MPPFPLPISERNKYNFGTDFIDNELHLDEQQQLSVNMLGGRVLLQSIIPVAYLLLSFLVFHYALQTPKQQLRWFFLPIFLCFAVLSFTKSTQLSPFPGIPSLWAQSVALNIIHVTSLLFLEKWPAPPQHPPRPSQAAAFYTTYRIWANPQLLPPAVDKSAKKTDEKEEEEPVVIFLLLRLTKLPLYYYLHIHVLPLLFAEALVELSPLDVAPTQLAILTRLSEITPRELLIRSYFAVSWIWESLVFLDSSNAVLAVVAVLSGLDRPADWPPLFNSPTRITSLRTFWSRFWHRLAVRPYMRYARVIASRGLGLPWRGNTSSPLSPSSSLALNTTTAFLVFLFSGVSHSAVSWRLGMRDYLDIKWFLLNFAACFVETVVLSTVRTLARRANLTRELRTIEESWLGCVVGPAWVFVFFWWSVPLWRGPRVYEALVRVENEIKREGWMEILGKTANISSNGDAARRE